MALKNSQYDILMRAYNKKQLKNRRELDERIRAVYTKVPRIQQIDQEIASCSVAQAKELLNGKETALSSLHKTLEKLSKEKEALLSRCGYPADYMQMHYDCPICKDTGFIDNKKCSCLKRSIIDMLYTQSNMKEILKFENFDAFTFDYYDNVQKNPMTGKTPFENMKTIYTICKQFIKNFGTGTNLFFYGDTGVGKTFLSNCIAKELIERSYSVIYLSAIELFELFSKHAFESEDREPSSDMVAYITNCDLLIIDDLGTELTNSFTNSRLFYCLNSRFLNRRSTLISTNLTLERLSCIYSERIFSRISSNYTLLKFYGEDIRLKKKLGKLP